MRPLAKGSSGQSSGLASAGGALNRQNAAAHSTLQLGPAIGAMGLRGDVVQWLEQRLFRQPARTLHLVGVRHMHRYD